MYPNKKFKGNRLEWDSRTSNREDYDDAGNARLSHMNGGRLMPQLPSADVFSPFNGPLLGNYDPSHIIYDHFGNSQNSLAVPPTQGSCYGLTNNTDSAYETASFAELTKSSTGLPDLFNGPQNQDDYFQSSPFWNPPSCFPLPGPDQYIELPMQQSNWNIPQTQVSGPADYPSDIPVLNSKRTLPTLASAGDATEDQPQSKALRLSSSHLIGATPKQERTLQRFQEDWEEDGHLPSEKELKALATLTKLTSFQVALWFGDKLRITPKKSEEDEKDISPPHVVDSNVLEEIANYIRKANAMNCSTSHSRKASGGKYKCTWGCGYSTDARDNWVRHEEKKQPQKFWHCVSCQAMRKRGEKHEPFLAHRIDKFLPHADSCHPNEDRDQLRAKSSVPYSAPFIRNCTFRVGEDGKRCNHAFRDWKERNDHYIRHFEDAILDQQPPFPSNRAPFDDDDKSDDDDDDQDIGPNSTGEKNRRAVHGQFTAPGSKSGQHAAGSHKNQGNSFGNTSYAIRTVSTINNRSKLCKANENSDDIRLKRDLEGRQEVGQLAAQWLINIENYTAIEPTPEHRYLALKYSAPAGVNSACLESAQTLLRPTLPPIDQLPPLFRKALDLAVDMAFQYLWIDIFCGVKVETGGSDTVYKQANLILVVGHPSQGGDQVWHFTCDYSHLSTVQSWAKQSVSFHHLQQLGHGAYGVVDKVQLWPTLDTFARKILFRTNTKKKQRTRYLHEIEIMQKFNHPHIARFVAAYYDGSAFNILMSPVADCDLRKFLAFPDQFPQQRKHLPKWFMSLAEALAYVHGKRCRHKDIKPANILISGSTVLLTDFGTSLDFSTTRSTSTGGALMTPKYCAPEVAASDSRGRSADVFSLGCVFTEMITIDLGKSLEDLHNWLRIEDESTDHQATYHGHLRELSLWLQMLGSLQLDDLQRRVLGISEQMLNEHPQQRPTAVEITKALCPKRSCNGLDTDATCHCCPRRRSTTALDLSLKNLHTFMPSEKRRMHLGVVCFKVTSWTGSFGKALAIGFVVLTPIVLPDISRTSQIQRTHWIKRQTMLLEKLWMALWQAATATSISNGWLQTITSNPTCSQGFLTEEMT